LCASAVRILGPLDPDLLRKGIDATVQRHESLRTRFRSQNGQLCQQVDSSNDPVFTVIDLSELPLSAAERAAQPLVQEFIDAPVDLSAGPLFEARAWKLGTNDYILVLLIDHMISDGLSNGILCREIWSSYQRAARGESPVLPRLAVQFADYAVWQERTREPWMAAHSAYWSRHLQGIRRMELPKDDASSSERRCDGSMLHLPFGEPLTTSLRQTARAERTLTSLLVLTAYAVVMSSWCRQEDLLILFASHGRQQPGLQNVIGFVATFLPLRVAVRGDATLHALIEQIKHELAAALRHRDFDRVPDFVPQCKSEAIFNWQIVASERSALDQHTMLEAVAPRDALKDELLIEPLAVRFPNRAKFVPVIFDTASGLHLTVNFRPDLLASTTVGRFGRNLLLVARELVADASRRIAPLLAMLDERPH
jgi:hypothetical protein